jgi:hypothetical protein
LRSARRAVILLIQLDHTAQACYLYLKLCSAYVKAQLKRVKRERTTIPYVKQLSAIAFSNIVEMSKEFLKIFPQITNCRSGKKLITILCNKIFNKLFCSSCSVV